jgi:predicted DsbA family dithiol-disulfide isomerase
MNTTPKMKVEIWSDIMCPFCYIGKRNYESAINQFADANNIELQWHSFQLDPTIPKQSQKVNVFQYLAERKGMSYEQSEQMHESVTATAKRAGLTYNFDKVVVANSFDAHRMIQFAKTKGLGDEAEEQLFSAYFTEGKDFGDHNVLAELGKRIGLNETEVTKILTSNEFANEVKKDIQEAANLSIRGVPFFVFDRKYAVSGAQPGDVFLQTLQKSFGEWRVENSVIKLEVTEGSTCGPDGDC